MVKGVSDYISLQKELQEDLENRQQEVENIKVEIAKKLSNELYGKEVKVIITPNADCTMIIRINNVIVLYYYSNGKIEYQFVNADDLYYTKEENDVKRFTSIYSTLFDMKQKADTIIDILNNSQRKLNNINKIIENKWDKIEELAQTICKKMAKKILKQAREATVMLPETLFFDNNPIKFIRNADDTAILTTNKFVPIYSYYPCIEKKLLNGLSNMLYHCYFNNNKFYN